MKTILGIAFGFFALTFAVSTDTFAQGGNRPRSINNRQQNQRQRIGQGIRSGELTARETARLVREQAQIRRMEERFRESGDGLSARERVRLQHELNQASRHIYRQKHDDQDYPRNTPIP